MSDNLKISFCVTVMNRLYHLKETLAVNLAENSDYKNCEFVILDYNSSDGLEKWMMSQKENFGDSVKYYKTTEPIHYLRSHSRNMVMKLATGDVLCNLDADNFLGKGFANYVSKIFSQETNIYLCPEKGSPNDVYGKICFTKEAFENIRGYDEVIKTYGFEDNDIKRRLADSGCKERNFAEPEFIRAITHTLEERIENEEIYTQIEKIYVEKIDFQFAYLTLLYKNKTYDKVKIEDGQFHECLNNNSKISPLSALNRYRIIEESMEKGASLFLEDHMKEVTNKEDFTTTIYFYSQLINKMRYQKNTATQNKDINPEGFGKGKVVNMFYSKKKVQ